MVTRVVGQFQRVGQVDNLRADCQSAQRRGLTTRAQDDILPHNQTDPYMKALYPSSPSFDFLGTQRVPGEALFRYTIPELSGG